MTANHVLGLEVVLPDGDVVQLGGDSVEQVGPDLTGPVRRLARACSASRSRSRCG